MFELMRPTLLWCVQHSFTTKAMQKL